MENYGIDSHKLIYHPQRVAKWLNGENIYPIFMEIGPAARCNQRCIFCAFDYTEYKGPLINEVFLKIMLMQAADMGLKSIVFAGEGEPFMHPGMASIIPGAKVHNLDVGLTTNGVLLDVVNSLPFLDWIRFSLDAATEGTYRKIHGCHHSHFRRVIENIRNAVEIKRRQNLQCTIGIQAVLLPENQDEIIALTDFAKGWGVDYLTIKPFSKHPLSHSKVNFDYKPYLFLKDELQNFSTNDFSVIFRAQAMEKLGEERPYKECLGLPFVTHLAANGDVYACSRFLGNKDFVYGNIYNQCFPEIWEGEQRQRVLKRVSEMGVEGCRELCRLDEINRYLWNLKHPESIPHVNFI